VGGLAGEGVGRRGKGVRWEWDWGRGMHLVQDFLPDVVCPVGSDGRDEEGLQLDVGKDEGAVHADPGGGGGFAVEIPGAGEVVEGVFQGKLVISTGGC